MRALTITPTMNEMSPIPSMTVTNPGMEMDASTTSAPEPEKGNSNDCAPVRAGSAGHMLTT